MGPRPGRHRSIPLSEISEIPDWMLDIMSSGKYTCVFSVAEEAYTAKFWADKMGASRIPGCAEPYSAGLKALVTMNKVSLTDRARSQAGTRAMRKFWEAKVAARREMIRR